MRTKIIKTDEEKKEDENKKRNYNKYYYHTVRKNKTRIKPDLKLDHDMKIFISNTVVDIEWGKFKIII